MNTFNVIVQRLIPPRSSTCNRFFYNLKRIRNDFISNIFQNLRLISCECQCLILRILQFRKNNLLCSIFFRCFDIKMLSTFNRVF